MRKGWKIVGCVVLGFLFLVLFGYVTMLLWNWLVPVLFNGPFISFWQALGLLVLSKILFSTPCRGGWQSHHRGHWKGKIYEKFSSMSPEQREAFKSKMKDRWCRLDKNISNEKA